MSHPPPDALDRPSYASLVANVDTGVAKYIADLKVQKPRQEVIEDLGEMAEVSACLL